MDVYNDEADEDALRQMAKGEYKLDDKSVRMMDYIKANLPIEGFAELLKNSEDIWLREVLKDVASTNPFVRMNALRMWGQHCGWLKKSGGPAAKRQEVDFGE
jgi:hypothetical protein